MKPIHFAFAWCLIGLAQLSILAAADEPVDPVPEMEVVIDFKKDKQSWDLQHNNRGSDGVTMQWVPNGQILAEWEEMVAYQILYQEKETSLEGYVKYRRSVLKRSDLGVKLIEKNEEDGSITLCFETLRHREKGINRYFKGKDAIYVLSYHARPEDKDPKKYALWSDIMSKAKLVKNTQIGKYFLRNP